MVNGFDIIGQNRTLQVHWGKRIVAFAIDCVVVLSPVWMFLFLLGERRVSAYGITSGLAFFAALFLFLTFHPPDKSAPAAQAKAA